ncbi:MAG: transposase [Candidatus Sumerlaeia bacterium]|nr:transposase [Candidatus Sumerlaeia bacterium]
MTRKLTPYHHLNSETRRAKRRRDAVAQVRDGESVAEVARLNHVSRQTLYTWLERSDEKTCEVELKPHGRPCLLTEEERQVLAGLLQRHPSTFGFKGHRWTLDKTRKLIKSKFNVEYASLSSVSMLLKSMCIKLRG